MSAKQFCAISFVLLAAFFVSGVRGQSITNWGKPVAGMQLSITLASQVVTPGLKTMLVCSATNLVSEVIIFAGTPILDLQVELTDAAGKIYHISGWQPEGEHPDSGPGYGVHPGCLEKYEIPLSIPQNIPPGNYQLKAHTKVRETVEHVGNRWVFKFLDVVSNALEVKIVSPK